MSAKENSRGWQIFLVVLGVLILGIPAGIIVNIVSNRGDTGSPSNSPAPPSSSPVRAANGSPRPSPGGTATPAAAQSTIIVPPPKPTKYLADVQFGDTNTANVGTGDVAIDKRDYPNSIWLCSDLELLANINCDSSKSPYWVDYNVPAGYSHFKTTIGFSTDSPSNCDVTAEIFGDGSGLYSKEISYGDSIPISRYVSKYLRIRLEIIPHKGIRCDTVFGNAEFTP